jgi:DNA (cytosine-5)-methyltransferase 1
MLNVIKAPSFLAVDFYCGAGGTTRGLLDAGGYVIAGIDKDEGCHDTYVLNNANETLDSDDPAFLALDMFPASNDYPEGQQSEVLGKLGRLIRMYRDEAPDIPLLFAICAPCQSFTKFVQRQMTDDRTEARQRDENLLAQTIPFIDVFQPEMVISENVASIKNGKLRHVWSDFASQLRDLGYSVGEDGVCASRFGVPQYRRRRILLALKKEWASDLDFNLPIPHHDAEATPSPSVEEAIEHLPVLQPGQDSNDVPNHVCRNLTEVNRLRLQSVEPGEPNFGFARTPYGDLSLPCHRRLDAKGKRGFGDVYTRIHPGRPAPTITTRFHSVSNGRFGHYDDEQVRGLSLREGAALQSFDDDYEFYGEGMDSIAKMIGNAVPPRLSAYMATWLVGLWRDTRGN